MRNQNKSVLYSDGLSFTERMTELQGILSVIERIKYLEMLIQTKNNGESESVADAIEELIESKHQLMIDLANDASYLVSGQASYVPIAPDQYPPNADLN